MTTDDIPEDDDRTLIERVTDEMTIDRPAELGKLARDAEKLAQFCEVGAPATAKKLRGVAADLRTARRMFNDEVKFNETIDERDYE